MSTYERAHHLATGVDDVWINVMRALRQGVAAGAASGRAVRGRAWIGAGSGGCRASARDWSWSR
jgi:N-acyl-D-amino-acid deacylase